MNSTNCSLALVPYTLPDGSIGTVEMPVIHRLRKQGKKQIPCAYYVPIIRIPLDTKEKRKLISYSFSYLGHLARITAQELEGYPFTDKVLASIKNILSEYSLSFAQSACFNRKDWINGNEALLSNKLFPPYLSLQTAWKLLRETAPFDPLTYLDKRLLIPLEFLADKKLIGQGQKVLTEIQAKYNFRRDFAKLYLGDVIATQTNLPLNRVNSWATSWKAETNKLKRNLQLEDCDCGYDWFQPGFETLSAQYFPNNAAVQAILSR